MSDDVSSVGTHGQTRVAVVQFDPVFGESERNRERIRSLTAGLRAELVVVPELAVSGYRFVSKEEVLSLAEPAADDAPTIRLFREIARESGALVVGGFAERGEGNACFNSAALVTGSGLLTVYRKLHLFGDERRFFVPGADLPPVVWTRCGLRVGVMICFDWLFPEVSRYLALEGADVIAHPANLVLPWCPDLMPLRCLENGLFAATADRVGVETRPAGAKPLRYLGRSQVLGPDGKRLVALGEREERVGVCAIEPKAARHSRLGLGGSVRVERRSEVFSLCPRRGPGDGSVRRWRLVEHREPAGDRHFDLFVERGSRLLTWRLEAPLAPGVCGVRTACHRRGYLERTGALGGGRGHIEERERGVCRVLEEGGERSRYRLFRADGGAIEWLVEGEERRGVALGV